MRFRKFHDEGGEGGWYQYQLLEEGLDGKIKFTFFGHRKVISSEGRQCGLLEVDTANFTEPTSDRRTWRHALQFCTFSRAEEVERDAPTRRYPLQFCTCPRQGKVDLRVSTRPSSSQCLPLNQGRGTLGIIQFVKETLEPSYT